MPIYVKQWTCKEPNGAHKVLNIQLVKLRGSNLKLRDLKKIGRRLG